MAEKKSIDAFKNYFAIVKAHQPTPTPFFTKLKQLNENIIPVKVDWNYFTQMPGTQPTLIACVEIHPSW